MPGAGADEGRWEELVPGVVRRRLPGWDATVGAVRGTAGLLVVDTGSGAAEGAGIRDGLRELFGLPVTHAVLTHSHFDHVFGTAAFEGAHVYGAQGLGDHLVGAREELRQDAVRHGMAREAAADSASRLVPPLHGVSEQITLTLGERSVRLVNMGAAHSGFDLAVLVSGGPGHAGRGVVFCGDLVEESGEPQAGPDASPSRWPRALDRLLVLGGEDALYVPGHGAVVGADFVRAQRDVLARRFAQS
ncbi:MBL fold metallo-hydrolase [Streptomyces abyssalis]|uniref:MBL fold metallo-hydrolase n=1 Tax=Streptomyces abyssalis TaxID=933944 RepID=A0A1E7JLS3_9ACTN|nr:MBL fold metallo-hydrolase [Streptomyces abyssalis]OEU88591.1 MBL fold metallo-hydrolase [Streptomyces abyssalis]OEV28607.1 MBL fold metallo-hydrolase [Streptomyces nanshensis]